MFGLDAALLANVSVPVRVPDAVGVNVTATAQLHADATERPLHESVPIAKSPDTVIPPAANVRSVLPVFVTVTGIGSDDDDTVVAGNVGVDAENPGAVPVPLNATVFGLDAALLANVNVPVRVPDAVGENLTATAQLHADATDDPLHESVPIAKSPDTVIPPAANVRSVFPVFVTVTGIGSDDNDTVVAGNVGVDAENPGAGWTYRMITMPEPPAPPPGAKSLAPPPPPPVLAVAAIPGAPLGSLALKLARAPPEPPPPMPPVPESPVEFDWSYGRPFA